jgi:methylaspartate mutase epsilon subunit
MSYPSKKNKIKDFSNFRKEIYSDIWLRNREINDTLSGLKKIDIKRFATHILKKKKIIVQPRGGFPTYIKQKKLSESLSKAGADFIPLTIDSLTRHNEYQKALQESKKSNKHQNFLNGYPLVSLGEKITKKIFKNIHKPISLRHGTPDPKVLVEVALLSGITEIEGGALTYLLPYARDYPLDKALFNWQYVDRLCAIVSKNKRIINRESFGPLTATMVPPFMVITIQLIELLLAAEQGVKSFSLSYGQTGSDIQDIAISNVMKKLAKKYLKRFNFKLDIFIVYHQWMGAFPYEKEKAIKLIKNSSIIAKQSQVDKIITKTFDEAFGIPSVKNNSKCVKIVKKELQKNIILERFKKKNLTIEKEKLKTQVEFLLEKIFSIKKLTFWETIYEAVRVGYIDVPYSTHYENANKLLALRDEQGAIRVLKKGNVPIDINFLTYEKNKLSKIKLKNSYKKIIEDINFMI